MRVSLLFLLAAAVLAAGISHPPVQSFYHCASIALAFVFTLFLPGYVIAERWFSYLHIDEKLVLSILLSVMLSTHLIYALSLIIGYNRLTIAFAFLIMLIGLWLVLLSQPHHQQRLSGERQRLKGIIISLGIAIIAFTVLSKTVWVWRQNQLIISGSNWQDTPMHYEIIESINNGNFPPEMPYYAGVRMVYHYFVDFHTAILEKAYGSGAFLPHLIGVTNTIFIFVFALSIFILASYLRDEHAGYYAILIGTLGAGFSFVSGLYALVHGQFVLTTNYAFEYGKFFTIPPIFDNLLQQRPQLIGLPALTTAAYLLYRGMHHHSSSSSSSRREIALSGLLVGLSFPFHILACLSAMLIFILNFIHSGIGDVKRGRGINKQIETFYIFSLSSISPVLLYLIPIMMHYSSSSGIVGLSIGIKPPWIYYFLEGNPLVFYIGNLGLPLILALLYLLFPRYEHPHPDQHRHRFFIYSWMFTLLALPNLFSFTPNPWDMYKFFHYAWIPIAIAAGCFITDLESRLQWNSTLIVIPALLLFSILSSGMLITWNISTNYPAADVHEYEAGLWVRNNTPPKSVFLTWQSIHAPVSMIGGRLRVLGYVNWAYGHGFNIWERVNDIKRAYSGNINDTLAVMRRYNATYLYIGREEMRHTNIRRNISKLESCKQLEEVYRDNHGAKGEGGIYIFALRTP